MTETGSALLDTPWGPVTVGMLLQAAVVVTLWAVGLIATFSYIAAARDACSEEQRRIDAELSAFEAFGERIRSLSPETPSSAPTPAGFVRPPGDGSSDRTDRLAAAREAYRETVMAVDHFEEDYDETLLEHARAEMGPDAGGALAAGADLTPELQSVLVERADAAVHERREFLGRLDEETADLSDAERSLTRLLGESAGLVRDLDAPFGSLEARWRRIETLEGHVDDVVADRTDRVTEAGAVPSYLYDEFPVPDPVLADASAALGVLRERRRRLTRALSRTD